jgi:uncharacterized protein (TIGR02145 family)
VEEKQKSPVLTGHIPECGRKTEKLRNITNKPGLNIMFYRRHRYFSHFIISGFILLPILTSCKKIEPERILQINAPEKTGMVDSTTVVVKVTIADLGDNNFVTPGFCWSEQNNPDYNDLSVTLGQINTWTTITDTISGLEADTRYYLKAFVIEENANISYSESELSFRTGTFIDPILSTDSVKIISISSARVYGRFVDKGNVEIIQYGHCWSITGEPKVGTDSITKYNTPPDDGFSSLLTNLKIRTPYYAISYAITQTDTVYADSSIHFKIPGISPSVTTDSASVSDISNAMFYGNVTSTGTDTIIQYGHCWSLEEKPTVLLLTRTTHVTSITTGAFSSSAAELLPDTTYYIRAYVITKYDTIYGEQKEFKTPPEVIEPEPPEVTTDSIDAIDAYKAYAYGTLIKTGTYPVIQHGHCWSIEQDPDVMSIYKSELGTKTITGRFESLIPDLMPDTVYYIKAYATTEYDTVYGIQKEYRTPPPPVTFTDARDGQVYEKVRIGDQWWMAENLNYYIPDGSYYYANDSLKYHQYGRLYTWDEALNACPVGWHLPTDEEWKTLEETLGMTSTEADNSGDRGTDQGTQLKDGGSSGFKAKLSGTRYEDGNYYSFGIEGYFWTATGIYTNNAWYRKVHRDYSWINRIYVNKSRGLSVRCVED